MSVIPAISSQSLKLIIEQLVEVLCNNALNNDEINQLSMSHEKLIAEIFEPIIVSKNEIISQRESQIKLLEQAATVQKEEIEKLQGQLIESQNEIARYKSILGNNSTNSGVTKRTTMLTGAARKQDKEENSDSDENIDKFGFTITDDEESEKDSSVNTYNGRKFPNKTSDGNTRQVGGQFDHEGKTLSRDDVEKIIEFCKEKGLHVYEFTTGVIGKGLPKTCYLLGMNPAPFVAKYTVYKNESGNYDYPRGITKNPVAYDTSVYAYIAYLRYECNLPYLKISNLIRDFTDGIIYPSAGTVENAINLFSQKCKCSFSFLEQEALDKSVLNTDATYVFLNGKHCYIRNLSCKDLVLYYGLTSKSKDTLEKIANFREYNGILCHDHEIVMYNFGRNEHGECIVHVMRYCRKNQEDSKNDWSKDLIEFFCNCQNFKEELIKIGINQLSEESFDYISRKYDSIIKKGIEQHKDTKNTYVINRENAFLKRLVKYKKHHLLFMSNFEVDWCNNLSERDLRAAKRFSLVTCGFRSERSFEQYCANFSVVQTIHRRNIPTIDGIRWIIDNDGNIFDPSIVETIRNDTSFFRK